MQSFKTILGFLLFLAIPLLVGAAASAATASSVGTWYQTLDKPFFNPPNWVFGPVWGVLYILMGVSSWLVYRSDVSAERTRSLDLYSFMLVLNFAWSFFFFGFEMPGLALLDIVLLWFVILAMIFSFYRTHKLAALLQVPYLLWVTFATVLNASIWWLN